MKIAAFSDSHGCLGLNGCIDLPKINEGTDIVLIAGDIFPLNVQRHINSSEHWFTTRFFNWVKELDVKKVVFVAGNHDFFLEYKGYNGVNELIKKNGLEDKLIYLLDNSAEIDGVKIYGSPWVTYLRNWAFYSEKIERNFMGIEDCDILLTHMPPKVDGVGCSFPFTEMERDYGSEELTDVFNRQHITISVCGHIHTGTHYGVPFCNNEKEITTIYNVSLLNESYNEAFDVTYFDI